MFDLDLQSRVPIYEQLYRKVVEMTVKKEMVPGEKLPSVREMAKALGVNPNTVSKAIQMLERDGVIYSIPGKGSFISEKNGGVIRENSSAAFSEAVGEAMRAGLTEEDMISIIKKIFTEKES